MLEWTSALDEERRNDQNLPIEGIDSTGIGELPATDNDIEQGIEVFARGELCRKEVKQIGGQCLWHVEGLQQSLAMA